MSLFMWLKEPGRRGELLWQLYGEDNEAALKALRELRRNGWLEDRSMRGVDLHEANLPGGDLQQVDLEEANLSYANLENADLSLAELAEAELVETNLKGANLTETNFYYADLRGADLTGAKLEDALLDMADLEDAVVTDEQLSQAYALVGAVMPDGSGYDGRFSLEGDLFEAAEQGFDLTDPESIAKFYDVPLEVYQKGQAGAKPAKPPAADKDTKQEDESDEIVKAIPYSPWNPLDYIYLVFDIFKDSEEILEYRQNPVLRDNLRVMSAWLAATLIFLPGLFQTIGFGIASLDTLKDSVPSFWGYVPLIQIGIELIAWALTGLACQQRGNQGKLIRAFAFIFAFILSADGSTVAGLSIMIGYVISLTVTQLVGSRASRVTIFWVAVLRIAGSVFILVTTLMFRKIPVPLALTTPGIASVAFSLSRYLWGILIIMVFRWIVKSSLLKELWKNSSATSGLLLLIGYFATYVYSVVIIINYQ